MDNISRKFNTISVLRKSPTKLPNMPSFQELESELFSLLCYLLMHLVSGMDLIAFKETIVAPQVFQGKIIQLVTF